MNIKLRSLLIGAVIGALVSMGLFGLCNFNFWWGLLGAIPGGALGLVLAIGARMREDEIETGLGS